MAPLNSRLTGPQLRNLVARSSNTLTRLSLNGCPLLNDAMLARAVQQQPCLVLVGVTACALATRPGLAYALCDAESFRGVVAQLNNPCLSAADAQRCCVALRTLLDAEDMEATLAEAQAARTLDALLRCAALHAARAGVQAACCYALARYVYTAQRTEVASYATIFQAAVTALKAYPLKVEVQRAALAALSNACNFGLEGTPGVPALLDAILPVVAALRAFPTDLVMQQNSCRSLALMCKMDASVAEPVAAAGALRLFLKTLSLKALNLSNEGVRIAAVDAIGAIALAPAALLLASAGINAVVRTLRRHEKKPLFAEAACKALGIYLRCPATRAQALERCADFVTKATAATHHTDAKVMKAAADALQKPQA